jgi:hypothetical protein
LLISTGVLGLILYLKNLLLKIWNRQLKKGEETQKWFVNLPGFMDFYFEKKKPVNLGNFGENFVGIYSPKAEAKVILVVNSECIHCKNILIEIDRFISRNKGYISIELRFNNISEINTCIIATFLSKQNKMEAWQEYMFYLNNENKNSIKKS